MELLTREQFREAVFTRDNHKCVVCGNEAKDAHHVMERRLFSDEGYYLNNGVSLCEEHHIDSEKTLISCDELRRFAGITKAVIPSHLYDDEVYDKWGNPILQNGMRLKGELFFDSSVQKILDPVLHMFANRVKYPRTHHFPWSPNLQNDDRLIESLDGFIGKEVVATIKMDGENTSVYKDYMHARSVEYSKHESRNLVKVITSRIMHEIPDGWRICGENVYAEHSIHYNNLEDYFLVFSVWDDKNVCLSWDNTVEWAKMLDLKTVPVLWRGVWDEEHVKTLYQPVHDGDACEGYVVRVVDPISYRDFRKYVGKYVRKGHVQTHGHWMKKMVVPNQLKGR